MSGVPITFERETLRKAWGIERRLRFVAHQEKAIRPLHPSEITFCPHCAGEIGPLLYSGTWHGETRWPFLCSECAAQWVEIGGAIQLRWSA